MLHFPSLAGCAQTLRTINLTLGVVQRPCLFGNSASPEPPIGIALFFVQFFFHRAAFNTLTCAASLSLTSSVDTVVQHVMSIHETVSPKTRLRWRLKVRGKLGERPAARPRSLPLLVGRGLRRVVGERKDAREGILHERYRVALRRHVQVRLVTTSGLRWV